MIKSRKKYFKDEHFWKDQGIVAVEVLALGDFEKCRVISIHIKAVLQQVPGVTTVRTEENINGTLGATQVDL